MLESNERPKLSDYLKHVTNVFCYHYRPFSYEDLYKYHSSLNGNVHVVLAVDPAFAEEYGQMRHRNDPLLYSLLWPLMDKLRPIERKDLGCIFLGPQASDAAVSVGKWRAIELQFPLSSVGISAIDYSIRDKMTDEVRECVAEQCHQSGATLGSEEEAGLFAQACQRNIGEDGFIRQPKAGRRSR